MFEINILNNSKKKSKENEETILNWMTVKVTSKFGRCS